MPVNVQHTSSSRGPLDEPAAGGLLTITSMSLEILTLAFATVLSLGTDLKLDQMLQPVCITYREQSLDLDAAESPSSCNQSVMIKIFIWFEFALQ